MLRIIITTQYHYSIPHTTISAFDSIISGAGSREFDFLGCDFFVVLTITAIVTAQRIKIENEKNMMVIHYASNYTACDEIFH